MVLSEIASFLLFSAINRHYSHKLRSQNNKKTQNNHKKTLHRNDMAFFSYNCKQESFPEDYLDQFRRQCGKAAGNLQGRGVHNG